MLYEMLAGRKPFRGASPIETMHAILNDLPPPLAGQPPEVNEILNKTLAKDPRERYQHAGDLAIDLRRLEVQWRTKSLPSMAASARPRVRKPMALAVLASGGCCGRARAGLVGRPPRPLRSGAPGGCFPDTSGELRRK